MYFTSPVYVHVASQTWGHGSARLIFLACSIHCVCYSNDKPLMTGHPLLTIYKHWN